MGQKQTKTHGCSPAPAAVVICPTHSLGHFVALPSPRLSGVSLLTAASSIPDKTSGFRTSNIQQHWTMSRANFHLLAIKFNYFFVVVDIAAQH